MELVFFRLFTGVIAILLGRYLTELNLVSVVFALSLTHNSLAFVYSKGQRTYLANNFARHAIPLTCLFVAISVTSVLDRPPIYFLFAIHHVCNETFFAQNKFLYSSKKLALVRAFFHAVVFFVVTRSELDYFGLVVSSTFWMVLLAASSGALLYQLKLNASVESKKDFSYESVSFLFAAFSLATKSGLLDYVLVYHFSFWAVYPLARLRSQGGAGAYFKLNMILFGLSLLFTPLGFHWGNLSIDGMSYVTRMTAFFHFFSSMALSYAHPSWMRKWFFADLNRPPVTKSLPCKIEQDAA